MLDAASAWNPVPVRLVAAWAVIGVVAAVIIVRLRAGDFGTRVGAALIAIGGTALVVLCASLGSQASRRARGAFADDTAMYNDVGRLVADAPGLWRRQTPVLLLGAIVPGSISKRPGTNESRFLIEGSAVSPRAAIQARYVGELPVATDPRRAWAFFGRLAEGGRMLDVEFEGLFPLCTAGQGDLRTPGDAGLHGGQRSTVVIPSRAWPSQRARSPRHSSSIKQRR